MTGGDFNGDEMNGVEFNGDSATTVDTVGFSPKSSRTPNARGTLSVPLSATETQKKGCKIAVPDR